MWCYYLRMNEVRFEEEPRVMMNPNIRKSGRITGWFVSVSFGLIKNEQQAKIVQIVIIVASLLFILGQMTLSDSENTVKQYTQQEIDAAVGYPYPPQKN